MTNNSGKFSNLAKSPFLWAISSAVLLILSFPGFSMGGLAWGALVPLLFSIRRAPSKTRAVFYGFVCGLVFYGLSLHWFTYVHPFAWIGVTLIEASSLMLFSWFIYESRGIKKALPRILWTALAWTTVEFLRSEIPIFGLGWNLLAFSQANTLKILQFANVFGAYGLGFLMVVVNACLFEIIGGFSLLGHRGRGKQESFRFEKWARVRTLLGLLVFTGLIGSILFFLETYGKEQLSRPRPYRRSVRISLIQGNIPQDLKWAPEVSQEIIEIYSKLTRLSQYDQPDLAIWPEAAFPGYFNRSYNADKILKLVQELQLPLLFGSPHLESLNSAFNSAYLLDGTGKILRRYDKQYLVPFGEYVPLKPIFGMLEPIAYTLGVSDFKEGRESVVFRVPNEDVPFSVLICFEDVFPDLARRAVDQGAQFLAVLTNDAWFGPTSAPFQHLDASIFRAVENGVPVVRAANTGVSAFISEKGIVLDRVRGWNGQEIFSAGKKTLPLFLNKEKTPYRQGGWLFPYFAALIFLISFFWKIIRNKKHESWK